MLDKWWSDFKAARDAGPHVEALYWASLHAYWRTWLWIVTGVLFVVGLFIDFVL